MRLIRTILSFIVFVFLAGMVGFCPPALAESSNPAWHDLTPQEQHILHRLKDRWDRIPLARKQRLLKGARLWSRLTPAERVEVKRRFRRWKRMSPERRKRIRESYRRFMKLSPDEQDRLRHVFKWWRSLPPERRKRLMKHWRGMSPAARNGS